MGIERRRRVHLPGRTSPVEAEGQRRPAGLWAQLFLPDIVRPAAAGLSDASAHHQHVDDAAIVHVHVVPVVQPGADDDHGAAIGLLRIERELAGHGDDLVARHAADLFRPGRRIRLEVVIGLADILAAEPAIDTVIGEEQVEHRSDHSLAVGQLQRLGRHVALEHIRVIGAEEMIVFAVAEIREAHRRGAVLDVAQRQAQPSVLIAGSLLLQTPFALLAPAEADRTLGHHDLAAGLIIGNGLPFRIVGLAHPLDEIGSAQEAVRHVVITLLHQPHQHRHVRVLAHIVVEIFGLPIDVEFLQDDVAHRHRQRRVGPLLRRNPEVGELGSLGIIRANHHALGAFVANLGIEMRIGRTCLWDVRSPQDQEAGVVPVGAFGDVGLLTPGLRRRRRKVAIPVIERHADATE